MAHDDPDLGGDFASDAHRRVMAAVPTPEMELSFEERLAGDTAVVFEEGEVEEILADLEALGYVKQLKGGDWRSTAAGHDLLTGPPKEARDE